MTETTSLKNYPNLGTTFQVYPGLADPFVSAKVVEPREGERPISWSAPMERCAECAQEYVSPTYSNNGSNFVRRPEPGQCWHIRHPVRPSSVSEHDNGPGNLDPIPRSQAFAQGWYSGGFKSHIKDVKRKIQKLGCMKQRRPSVRGVSMEHEVPE